jgi:hypothetical protein
MKEITVPDIVQDVETFALKLEAEAALLLKNLFSPASEQAIATAAEDVAGVISAVEAAQAAGSTGLVAVITAAFKFLAKQQSQSVQAPQTDALS